MELSDLRNRTAPFNLDGLKGHYYINVVDKSYRDLADKVDRFDPEEASEEDRAGHRRDIVTLILRRICDWELTSGGEPIPLTADAIDQFDVPDDALLAILRHVSEDRLPNRKTGNR